MESQKARKTLLDAEFEESYKRLNPKQKEAVDQIDGPVMVIAGPGTGKTTILTLRIANILKKTDTPANGILAITYTEAGVRAMRSKLQEVIGDRAYDVRLHTFHGFASSIIAEYPDHFLHLSDMRQMTDVEQESLIRNIILEPRFATLRPSGRPDVYISSIMRSIEDSKREAFGPNDVRSYAKARIEEIKNDASSLSTRGATKGQLKAEARDEIERCERTLIFADIYEIYEARKRQEEMMDFDDLLIELLHALRTDELLLRLLQERYLYIHVDEHQDTNDAQNLIVRMIAEFFDTPNVFIVGDEKQAIYRFQGASVENFFSLQKEWPAMKIISLNKNYRSHQSIIDASFGMIEKNYEGNEHFDLRIRLESGSDAMSQPIEVVTGENISAMELYLVDELKKLEPTETAAIIVRRNRDLHRVIRLLEFHGIPVSSERSVDIFSHPIGRVFFDLLEYLADTSRLDSLAHTIIAEMWELSFEDAAHIVRSLNAGIVSDLELKLPDLYHIQALLLSEGPVGFIIRAAEESGFAKLVATDPSYVHVWRGIVILAESLVRESDIEDPMGLVKNMLAYKASAESRTVKIAVGASDVPISAITAHGSKGLEFDRVFIPYATDNTWIGRPRGTSFVLPQKRTDNNDIRDLRRLFYVALTRARSHVTILTALEEADGTALTPLRFIEELDKAHISNIRLSEVGIEKVYQQREGISDGNDSSLSQMSQRSQKIIDLAKEMLLKSGLSVTALNHFMNCPNEFIYESVLKMPQSPNISAEKGTAMHIALSDVWKNKIRSSLEIEKSLMAAVTEYFDTSFLGLKEKALAKNELFKIIPDIACSLEGHFIVDDSVKVFAEAWVEARYDGTYEGERIAIPLHGKLDAVLDKGNEIEVYDYKTRQSMSEAAIRGETKNSDGNYFRQLIFYKLLMSDDPRFRGRKIVPALVFVSPDAKGRCSTVSLPIGIGDMDRVRGEIQTLLESVWSGKILKGKCDDEKCVWCGMREIGEYPYFDPASN